MRIGLLKSFLAQRSTPLLGIDISSAAIRIIELARLSDGWRVEHYAEHELPRAVMREGSIVQVDQIKETIAERMEMAQAAGIRTVVIDIESQALMAALHSTKDSANNLVASRAQAVLQIGRDSSYFFVKNRRALIFEHELTIGFQRLQKDLERHPEQVVATTEAFCAAVCQEFKRALQMYSTTSQHAPIDKFFLSGQEQSLFRLPSMIQEQLSVIAEFANPFADMKFSPAVNKSKLQKEASSWLVACGLAMSDKAP